MTTLSRYIRRNVDLLVLLPVLAVLIAEARTYPGTAATYLLIVLVPAIVFTGLELLIDILPKTHTQRIRHLVSGHASDVTLDLDDSAARTMTGPVTGERSRLVVFIGLLFGFFVIAYLVGFIYAIPLFVISVVYLLGSQNLPVAVAVSIFLAVVVYGLFGRLMNVPVL